MRRASIVLAGCLFLTTPLAAQLPSPYELVRGLRTAGLVDLAAQRLEELKAKPGALNPEDLKIYSLELARTRLEQAAVEPDDAKRIALLGQARSEFDTFIKTQPQHPLIVQANVEIARLLALQGKAQLSKAKRSDEKSRPQEMTTARNLFQEAITNYQKATTALANQIKGMDAKSPLQQELEESRLQATLDTGILLTEQAQTFAEQRQKSDNILKAQKLFDQLADEHANHRVGKLAHVWSLQCQYEIVDPAKSVSTMEKYEQTNRNNRAANEAVRLARFFAIQHIFESDQWNQSKEQPLSRLSRADQAAARWLTAYPESRNTPEGLGARYRRAIIKEQQARLSGGIKIDEKTNRVASMSADARRYFQEANAIYRDLSDTENEYADRAQRNRLTNQVMLLDADGKGGDPPLNSIKTLEDGYLAAQIQQARLLQAAERFRSEKSEMTAEQLMGEEKKREANALRYLERGLQKKSATDTPRDLFDAQMLLVHYLTKTGRANEAAILGEALSQQNPRNPKAARAALLGIYAYNTSIAQLKEAGAEEDVQEVDLSRLKNLAQFAEKTWPNDSATDGIRHVVAFYQNKEGALQEAWNTYNRIGTNYGSASQARREMAGVLFNLVRPTTKDAKAYRETLTKNIAAHGAQWKKTLNLLETLPVPTAATPTAEAESYLGAKTMLAQLYFMSGDYGKVDEVVKNLTTLVPTLKELDEKKRDDLSFRAQSLRYNSVQGKLAELVRTQKFDQIPAMLDPELIKLKEALKTPAPSDPPAGFDILRKAQRDLIIGSMAAFVQNKQIDRANELLDVLKSTGSNLESNLAVLRQLSSSIRTQIDGLRKETKTAEADELAASFTTFLDNIGKDPEKLSVGVISFLGQGYSAIDNHLKAAELFQTILDRPFENKGKTDEEKKELENADIKLRRQLSFMQARSYRLAGGDVNLKKASTIMAEIVGNPLDKSTKRGWGFGNIEARKEYIHLLEDMQKFGPAISNWKLMVNSFVPGGLPAPPKAGDQEGPKKVALRQVYFDLFYETNRSSARAYSTIEPAKLKMTTAQIDDKLAGIGQALYELVSKNSDISEDIREKVLDLVEKYPAMKKKYDELSASAKTTSN
jgi:hypothetical protein